MDPASPARARRHPEHRVRDLQGERVGLLMIVAIVVVPLTFISAFLGGVVFAPDTQTETIFGQTVEVTTRERHASAIFAALIGVVIG